MAVPLHRTLEHLAALAAIRGDSSDEALFTRAASLVLDRQIESDADLGPLLDATPGEETDGDVYRRLRHMYDAGAWILVESAIADLPADLRWLFESGAVTIEQLASLHHALGATSAADLADAVQRQAVRSAAGLDAAVEYAVAAALFDLRVAVPRIPLGRATALAEPYLDRLRSIPAIRWALPVGSLRRGQDTVGDVEIVAPTDDPTDVVAELAQLPEVTRVLHRSPRKLCLLLERAQLNIRFPEPAAAGAMLLTLTGSHAHVDQLRTLATEQGWRLQRSGLHSKDGRGTIAGAEEDIYAALGLPFIPPEIRNGEREIEVARRRGLPDLVDRVHIRGDLHMHSTYSDGRDSIEAMVKACRSLGYEYIAITDHSPHSAASRNLTIDGVKRQAEEIGALRQQYPELVILHGCEVDILPDGRLDFSDKVLERFDLVLASLHERAGQSSDHLLRRYATAMRHPLVTVITHPANRLVPHKPGYDLDYDALFETAVQTGTALEIDGAPVHLDLEGALAHRAIDAGVTIVISSDSHRAEMLDRQMQLGLLTARRGWVEPKHVLNSRPLADLRAFIARKRGP